MIKNLFLASISLNNNLLKNTKKTTINKNAGLIIGRIEIKVTGSTILFFSIKEKVSS